jgi:hypothetical protein
MDASRAPATDAPCQRTTGSETANPAMTSANAQCTATGSFSHLLIRKTKDVAPCFTSKKREARNSD